MNFLIDSSDISSMVIAVALGLGIGWLINRNKGANKNYEHISVLSKEEFTKNMRRGQLVDMRKKDAFETDKIKGARNFTPSQMTLKYPKLRKDMPIYLYCENGKKSKSAARKLIRNEYKQVYILEGGFTNYNN